MIRKFTEDDLKAKAAQRPAGYREEVLALAELQDDGSYEIDTNKPEYILLLRKYCPADSAMLAGHKTMIDVLKKRQLTASRISENKQNFSHNKSVPYAALIYKHEKISEILGSDSREFDKAVATYNEKVNNGSCKGCAKSKLGREIAKAFISVFPDQSDENKDKLRKLIGSTLK